jgi:hypothetical protein
MFKSDQIEIFTKYIEFCKLRASIAFECKNPLEEEFYNLIQHEFDQIIISRANRCYFILSDDLNKTIREIYKLMRKPKFQQIRVFLSEKKPSVELYILESQTVSIPVPSKLIFLKETQETLNKSFDIELTVLKNSIEVTCITELDECIKNCSVKEEEKLKENSKKSKLYFTNHNLIDEFIDLIYSAISKLDTSNKPFTLIVRKPEMHQIFRDSFRPNSLTENLLIEKEGN